jgi:hypothetical protein
MVLPILEIRLSLASVVTEVGHDVQQRAVKKVDEVFKNTIARSSGKQSWNVPQDGQNVPQGRWTNG